MKIITITYNPETHKLVPKDLADDTIDAACDAGGLYRVEFVRAWDAALDAAPEAPEQAISAQWREAVKVAREALGSMSEQLQEIAELAHAKSTGPAVWDEYWNIRNMAYNAMDGAAIERLDVLFAVALEQAETQQEERERPSSPTAGMNIAQRILHVGGRNNAAGYVEFGSIQAVEALVRQVLRDLPEQGDHWQQYAKPGETAQQCIERHRAEQDALMTLLAQARAEPNAQAVREAGAAPAVPQGYALVPVEPTQEMVEAGNEKQSMGYHADEVYRAMLVAAPQAQTEGGEILAWVTEDGDRAITASTKAAMLRDGGASASSMKPFCVPAFASAAEGGEVERDAARLDWLTFNLSGASLRAIGVIWSEHGDARRAIDAAMSASAAKEDSK